MANTVTHLLPARAEEGEPSPPPTTSLILYHLMKVLEIGDIEMSNRLKPLTIRFDKLSRNTVRRWRLGEMEPHPWQIPYIAKALGVPSTLFELDSNRVFDVYLWVREHRPEVYRKTRIA
jgi:hypothetical protein